jgi:hypothetical protein
MQVAGGCTYADIRFTRSTNSGASGGNREFDDLRLRRRCGGGGGAAGAAAARWVAAWRGLPRSRRRFWRA